jgi:hypothetical protein
MALPAGYTRLANGFFYLDADGSGPFSVDTNGVPYLVGGAGTATANAASTPVAIASGTADVQGIAAQANLRLVGFSVTEDAGTAAAAEVILRHGTAATDPELFGITLTADQSTREYFGPNGIAVASGVFVDRVAGTTKLTLFYKVGV